MTAVPPALVPERPLPETRGSTGLSFAIIGSRGFPSTYGGYETLVRYLARHMVAEGHHVTVYCREPKDGRRVWHEEGVRCIATRGKDSKQLSTLSFGASSIADAALRRYDAALVLNIANGFWLPALRAAGVPFAVNTDGLEWKRAKWSKLGKAVFRTGAELTARLAPELICDSEALGDIWEEDFGRKSTFIPYGGELRGELTDERVRGLGVEPGKYALVVARLAPENNVELTLDAVELLGDDAPKLVVVGSANFDNPITGRLERMQSDGKVLWLGHVADQDLLAELWQHCGVYVHGHSVGGTNPALLQALGAGAPTIALDTVFNREVLANGGHLFEGNSRVLSQQLAAVVASESLRYAMSERGRKVCAARYTWERVCLAYTESLVRLAHSHASASRLSRCARLVRAVCPVQLGAVVRIQPLCPACHRARVVVGMDCRSRSPLIDGPGHRRQPVSVTNEPTVKRAEHLLKAGPCGADDRHSAFESANRNVTLEKPSVGDQHCTARRHRRVELFLGEETRVDAPSLDLGPTPPGDLEPPVGRRE